MEIYIGADYRGFNLKQHLLSFLQKSGHEVYDLGAYEIAENGDDFNDAAIKVAQSVRENRGAFGILICDSAHGMTMQANRFRGIRAAHCGNVESAKLAREHDDANVLCLSARFTDERSAEEITEAFLTTIFEPIERRVRRINRLDEGQQYD